LKGEEFHRLSFEGKTNIAVGVVALTLTVGNRRQIVIVIASKILNCFILAL
jgi:hypothetical protein